MLGKWIFLALVLTQSVYASQGSFFKYGLGVNGIDQRKASEIKTLSGGYQDELFIFETKIETGLFVDNTSNAGARNSAFGSYSVGIEPHIGNFYVNTFQGLALITAPDNTLGSFYQFAFDFGFGVRDDRGVAIGTTYKHISNAGIVSPNKGRDFVGLQLQIPY